jgi:hypothetical protein
MLTYENFSSLASIQASIFTPTLISDHSNLLKKLFNLNTDMFDGAPTVLPLPQDAPPDIPRITLQNKANTLKLEVSLNRVNFYRLKGSREDFIIPIEFYSTASSYLSSLLQEIGAKCVRIAAVMKRYYRIENPASEIATHFSKESFLDEPFDRPSEFEIHSLKKCEIHGFDNVNSWVRVKSGIIHEKGSTPKPAIIIEQDINTLPENMGATDYNETQINHFYNNINDEFENIIKLYFPAN